MDAPEIVALDAIAQAELVRRRQVTPQELAEAAISRICAFDAKLNFMASEAFETALRAPAPAPATAREEPFAGVPFLVKDLIAQVDTTPQTEGSLMLARQRARGDSELVRRYRSAGLNILGRTTTSEFGHAPITESRLFGVTRNPWAPDRTAGGSSGGSAVAVATRCVPVAHGNDSGGSLRIPASCCGVFGLKPRRGRQPMEAYAGQFSRSFAAEHVISVSVRDSAALLDWTTRQPAESSFLRVVIEPRDRPLRVALQLDAVVDVPVHQACRDATIQTATDLESLGHRVEPAAPSIDGDAVFAAWLGLWADATGWQVRQAARHAGRAVVDAYFDTLPWRMYTTALRRTPLDSQDDLVTLQLAADAIGEFLETYDAWLMPTLAQPPIPHGAFVAGPDAPSSYLRFSPFARLANLSGTAACSIPAARTADGLPIGVQLIARDEAVLFALAAGIERMRPWAGTIPTDRSSPAGPRCCSPAREASTAHQER